MTKVTQHNEWVDKKSTTQNRESWFKLFKKKVKETAHKIWESFNSPWKWSYYDTYKDKPDEITLSQADFYYPECLNDIRNTIHHYYNSLKWEEKPDFKPFFYAMVAYGRLHEFYRFKSPYIWVVDFSKPNTQNRFFIINLKTLQVENALPTWHWTNSWKWEIATEFSNEKWSLQSSLWAFLTCWELKDNKEWTWKWLHLRWHEHTNFRSYSRWIFIHPWGVNQSEGCFTIPYEHDKQEVYDVIKKLEWECLVYSYHSEDDLKDSWINNPTTLNIFRMLEMPTYHVTDRLRPNTSKRKSRTKNESEEDKQKKE